ncbi:MAG: hypothetical protein K2Q13_04065 [Nitrosomonas sp.]|uniref:hypothetical protein n=1 Tax=Nitrosomonas sp. TaxID=42353 RepID=UPI0025F322DF|nr:hypothetical protein [Nitrosomonas sp.]MBY0474223.1 hypothetical protein [Nitrosomonas sp.]
MLRRKYDGCPYLTPEDLEKIAELAAEKAVIKMTDHAYKSIGKSVVSRFLWAVGVVTVAFAAWLHSKGMIG